MTATPDEGEPGTTYLAREPGGVAVAVTRLAEGDRASAQDREQLRSVLGARSRLDHPNLAKVYDLIEDRGEVFVAEQYLPDPSLDRLLCDTPGEGTMPVDAALAIVLPVLDALEHAHAHGVVHRAVQPGLIVPGTAGAPLRLKGLALTAVAEAWPESPCAADLASVDYLSPEQRIGQTEVDCHADIFSCAVVLFRLVTGRFPYWESAGSLPSGQAEVPDARRYAPGVPAGVSQAIAIALRLEPRRRFHSASDFSHELKAGLAGLFPLEPSLLGAPVRASAAAAAPAVVPPVTMPEGAGEAAATGAAETVPSPPADLPQILISAALLMLILGAVLFVMFRAFAARPVPVPPLASHAVTNVPPEPVPEEPPAVSPPTRPVRLPQPVHTPVIKVPQPVQLPQVPSPTEMPTVFPEAQIEQMRSDLLQRMELLSAKLDAKNLTGLEIDLAALEAKAASNPQLRPEAEQVAALRRRLQSAQQEAIDQAAWQKQLDSIDRLIQQGKFPEAISLAGEMTKAPGVPEPISEQARRLSARASAGLQKVLSATTVGQTQNHIVQPPAMKERS